MIIEKPLEKDKQTDRWQAVCLFSHPDQGYVPCYALGWRQPRGAEAERCNSFLNSEEQAGFRGDF